MGEEYRLIGALMVFALGASLLLGTGAAMVRVKRTGKAPGQDREHAAPVATPGVLVRLTIGALIAAGGVVGVWWYFA